jgi:hypothetical protein
MVSTFTPNIQWEQPARGDDVGTWDGPVNNNGTLIDLIAGGIATQALTNANIVLSNSQFQSKGITFNSTLSASVTITFPTSFKKSYEVFHACFGSSAFTITLQTTAAGGEAICCPPGEWFECVNDGTNIRFKNFGRVGSYWDYAGSSVPNWVGGCTKAPYLNCDGTTFSSATNPVLTVVLGGTTLPDSRGRARFAINQGTGRLANVINGNTVGAGGGLDFSQLVTGNLPAYTPSGSVSINQGGVYPNLLAFQANGNNVGYGGTATGGQAENLSGLLSATFTGNAQGGASAIFGNLPPAYAGGLTLIRAG